MFKCCRKLISWTLIAGLVVGGVGFLTFGTSFGSYLRTSVGMVKTRVNNSIPIPLEIQRAKDMLDQIIPEMKANLRLAAAEEVEVANLEDEIEKDAGDIETQRGKLQRFRDALRTENVSFRLGKRQYNRAEMVTILSSKYDQLTTAENFHKGRKDLLKNRKRSLAAAMKNLDRTRLARVELESKIEALEEQFRLMQLKCSGAEFQIDNSSLSQVEKVIKDLKTRLDIAQKVMASEALFIDDTELDITPEVDEISVMERVDSYLIKTNTVTKTEIVLEKS